jgi:hypothetical protein
VSSKTQPNLDASSGYACIFSVEKSARFSDPSSHWISAGRGGEKDGEGKMTPEEKLEKARWLLEEAAAIGNELAGTGTGLWGRRI